VVIHRDEAKVLKALMERYSIDRDQASSILGLQMSSEQKMLKAGHIIINNTTLNDLKKQAKELIKLI
jgi:dephospho-CoA kinase